MSFRETSIIGALVVVVGGAILLFVQLRPGPEPSVAPPFFYELQTEAIQRIAIAHGGSTQAFAWDESSERWVFEASRQPVDPERWGGMPVLLSGPRIERTLPVSSNLDQYGLEPARTVVTIGLEDGSEFRVLVGAKTADGSAHYVMQAGVVQVLLVDSAWADVIESMVVNPPRL
jgi:hypothetical protein